MSAPKYISFSEVQKHTSRESCWVVIDAQVYDATSIIDTHPGGSTVLLKNAGKDATYGELHYDICGLMLTIRIARRSCLFIHLEH